MAASMKARFAAAVAAPLAFVAADARASWLLTLTEGITPISHEAHWLHNLAYWICVAIGIGVYGTMAWALFHFRKSRGVVPATFSHNTKLEIVWTIIPLLILIAIAVPSTLALIRMTDTSDPELTVKITGQQWRWRYDYVGEGVGFFSSLNAKSVEASKLRSGISPASVDNYLREVDNPLVLPVGRKIRFLFTATDVIHSWWVPDLGYKVDTNPGFINEAWARLERPGIYRGQCAELCGMGHGYMPAVVQAMAGPEFDAWLAAKKTQQAAAAAEAERGWSREELMARGEQLYVKTCAACHQPTGKGVPGAFPPLDGSPIVKGPLGGHLDIVMNGKPGTAMQAFATQLSDVDLAGILTYERNAWSNKTGDVVSPSQVKAARR